MTRVMNEDVEIHVSPDNSPSSYNIVASGRSFTADHGNTGDEEIYVYGSGNAIVLAGDLTSEFTLTVLAEYDDTNGQTILRNAYWNKTTIYIAYLYDATGGAEEGWTAACQVLSYTDESEREGNFVGHTFRMKRTGTKTDLTTGLP